MKQILIGILSLLFTIPAFSQTKEVTIECMVECGGCKKKIESTLNNKSGVDTAQAYIGKHKVVVSFNSEKTSALQISETLANIGFKTKIESIKEIKTEEEVAETVPAKTKKTKKQQETTTVKVQHVEPQPKTSETTETATVEEKTDKKDKKKKRKVKNKKKKKKNK